MFPTAKQPITIMRRINNIWMLGDGTQVIRTDDIANIMASRKEVFIKVASDSYGGHGVRYLSDEDITAETFFRTIGELNGDLVVQECVRQHHVLSALNPSSVNTIRIFSLLTEGEVWQILYYILNLNRRAISRRL